jgi:hypothetical protein
VGATPIELPLIQYLTMNFVNGGTFNIGLGTLPNGYAGYLTNDTANLMVALVLTSAVNPQPRMNALSLSGANLSISGTNGFANRPYYLLASTNVALPLASWARIATNIFDSAGNFSATTSIIPGVPARFYAIQTQ